MGSQLSAYFTKSSGYRKIPGDMCFGGTQLAPQYFHCQAGILGMHWSTVVIGVVLIGACYYGWAFIEAILILLPIPDPKGGIDAVKGYGHQFENASKISSKAFLKSLTKLLLKF